MGRRARLGGLACLAMVLGGAGCGQAERQPPSAQPMIDEVAGTYRGAGIGQSREEIGERLGPPPRPAAGDDGRMQPLDVPDGTLVGLPGVLPPRGSARQRAQRVTTVRYGQVSFLVAPGFGAYAVMVTDPEAATRKGVAIGATLDDARAAYDGLECGVQNRGTEYEPFPYCTGRVAPQRYVWFGGDPIGSITTTVRPMTGPDPFT